jgi:hypothetical protein
MSGKRFSSTFVWNICVCIWGKCSCASQQSTLNYSSVKNASMVYWIYAMVLHVLVDDSLVCGGKNTAINPEKQHYTMEEYLEMLQSSDRKMEYDHGSIYVMSGGTLNHTTISGNVFIALDAALGLDSPCVPYIPDVLVKAGDEVRFFPDVVISCDPDDQGKLFYSNRLV